MKLYLVLCKQTDYNQYHCVFISKSSKRAKDYMTHNKYMLRMYEQYELHEIDTEEPIEWESREK